MKLSFIDVQKGLKELNREDMKEIKPTLNANFQVVYDYKSLINDLLKEKESLAPVIKFTEEAYKKVMALVDGCSDEIAWHGLVRQEGNVYTIYDILMYKQRITAATVQAIEEEYPLFMNSLDDDQFNNLRMQGHSHVNMAVYASAPDEAYYKNLQEHMTDYYIIMIINKSEKMFLRFYDIENNIVFNELVPEIEGITTYKDWAKEQMAENIVKPVSTPAYAKNDYYGGGYYDDYGLGNVPPKNVVQKTTVNREKEYIYRNDLTGKITTKANITNAKNENLVCRKSYNMTQVNKNRKLKNLLELEIEIFDNDGYPVDYLGMPRSLHMSVFNLQNYLPEVLMEVLFEADFVVRPANMLEFISVIEEALLTDDDVVIPGKLFSNNHNQTLMLKPTGE